MDYAIRNCKELGGEIKDLSVHAGLEGCKGYFKGCAIMAFNSPLRICTCEEEREARLLGQQQRPLSPPKKTLHDTINPDALGACTRFTTARVQACR